MNASVECRRKTDIILINITTLLAIVSRFGTIMSVFKLRILFILCLTFSRGLQFIRTTQFALDTSVVKNTCLENDLVFSIENEISLIRCASNCLGDEDCKSFVFSVGRRCDGCRSVYTEISNESSNNTDSLYYKETAECSQIPTVNGGNFQTPNGVREGATGTTQCPSGISTTESTISGVSHPESTATCLPTGVWSTTSFVCWTLVGSQFDGQTLTIENPFLSKEWHNSGLDDKKISIRVQPNDPYVVFDFQFDAFYGSYKILNHGFVCDGYNTTSNWLHTGECADPERQLFYLYNEFSTELYLIKSMLIGRFVRIDEDRIVSTIQNLPDDRAKFKIIP